MDPSDWILFSTGMLVVVIVALAIAATREAFTTRISTLIIGGVCVFAVGWVHIVEEAGRRRRASLRDWVARGMPRD